VIRTTGPSCRRSSGTTCTWSKRYVPPTNCATSGLAANRCRVPSGSASMTSTKAAYGDSVHSPTTIRTPLLEPSPVIVPWNRRTDIGSR